MAQILPVTTKDMFPYTPRAYSTEARAAAEAKNEDLARFDNPPVYYLSVPSAADKARFAAEMARQGLRYPPKELFIEQLREGIRQTVEAGQQEELLTLVDDLVEAGDEADADLRRRFGQLESQIKLAWGPLAQLFYDQALFNGLAPIIACQHFLKRVSNCKLSFSAGMLTEASLGSLPDNEVSEVGWQAIINMTVSKDQEKN